MPFVHNVTVTLSHHTGDGAGDRSESQGVPSMSCAVVIDGDEAMRELVRLALERDGFHVDAFPEASPVLEAVLQNRYDLVVLDASLSQVDGLTFIARVRAISRVPILMRTVPHNESDIVRALDLGADDYVTTPFSLAELLIRVRIVTHRHYVEDDVILEAGGVRTTIDLLAHMAKRSNERQIQRLTASEVAVLRILFQSRGRPVARRTLLRALADPGPARSGRTLDVHVCRIRQKIEPCPEAFSFIRTLRGLGYMWADPDQAG